MVLTYTRNNLRLVRKNAEFNQRELAEKVHVAQSILSDLELGKRVPWSKLARKLSRILGVTISDLFPEDFPKVGQ